MPDERRWVQAKFKKKTCDPRFNENFAFQVSNSVELLLLRFLYQTWCPSEVWIKEEGTANNLRYDTETTLACVYLPSKTGLI